jgi:hypothetical protein
MDDRHVKTWGNMVVGDTVKKLRLLMRREGLTKNRKGIRRQIQGHCILYSNEKLCEEGCSVCKEGIDG